MALSTISGTTGITDATITSAKLADFSAAVDLNGVELLLDADADTSITADTDDRIDFKLGGVEHISLNNSSGDTVIKPMVNGKDIVFQQYDGNKILEINDGNYVAISGAAAGPGELRFYEDTDHGAHYTGFKAGNATASLSYVLPLADGTDGYQLTTDGSGTLSWTAAGVTLSGSTNNTIATVTGANALAGEANLTFDGSLLTVNGEITTTTLDIGGTNVTATAAEINLIDGGTARGTTAVASGDGILINDAGTMAMTNVDTVSTYFASHSVGGTNIVTTGALNAGSITSGFGTINNGSSTITTTGAVATGALTVTGQASATTGIASTETDTSNSGSITLDFSADQNFVLTLTGNVTLANPSTEAVGQSGFIAFIQDGTGSRTVSLGTDYETAAAAGITLTTTASATDLVPYLVVASNRILLGTPQLAFA